MGKYMTKAKITADVAVMEIPQSTLGVRTRAKTLALQTLQSSSSSIAAVSPVQPSNASDSECYLQLRSRSLLKTMLLIPQAPKSIPQKPSCKHKSRTISNPRSSSRLRPDDPTNYGPVPVESASISRFKDVESCCEARVIDDETENNFDLGLEASCGENNLDFEAGGRSTRESTPCSLIRGVAVTPGSSMRQTNSNACSRRNQGAILRNIPLAYEMEEFFSHAEQQQQQQFIDKYNFDVTRDMPLPGRYEWVRVNQ